MRQAFHKLCGCFVSNGVQRFIVNVLLLMTTVILTMNFAICFYWMQYRAPDTAMARIYELNAPETTKVT